MADDIEALHQRIHQLELIEREYHQMQALIDDAAHDRCLERYGEDIILYADPDSLQIIDANSAALAFFGFEKEPLCRLSIAHLEVIENPHELQPVVYSKNEYRKEVYSCAYRHCEGHLLPVRVHKRSMLKDDRPVLSYLLEDLSLRRQLWHELQRREDAGYQFQQKLRILNEISTELSLIESFDELCWHGIKYGVERLGFTRMSMWFYDETLKLMVGSVGVSETGELRDERDRSWTIEETVVVDFLYGRIEPVMAQYDAPIFNQYSQVIGYGWHIGVPLINGNEFIGYMTADNLLHQQPMKSYEPELLRLYGSTMGRFTALIRARQHRLELRFEQERVQMLKTFINDVGHDFRTPLTVINTNTYLLQKVTDETRREEIAHSIYDQAKYLGQMIDDMLEIVRLKSDLVLRPVSVDLTMLLDQVMVASTSMAEERQIELIAEPSSRVTVQADAEQLRQALCRLVKNAITYTQPGGSVTLSLHGYAHEIGIRVKDTGVGIEKAHIETIFKPHYRINEARTERGSGLGLSIAKLIIEAHRGRIEVQSTPGVGSMFEIILPVA